MSIHPSLVTSGKNKKHKTVLKRIERLRLMLEKNKWKEGDDVYGLPKIKTLRIKVKKEKAEKVEAAAAEGTAPAASPETKEQAPTKGPAAKGQDKK